MAMPEAGPFPTWSESDRPSRGYRSEGHTGQTCLWRRGATNRLRAQTSFPYFRLTGWFGFTRICNRYSSAHPHRKIQRAGCVCHVTHHTMRSCIAAQMGFLFIGQTGGGPENLFIMHCPGIPRLNLPSIYGARNSLRLTYRNPDVVGAHRKHLGKSGHNYQKLINCKVSTTLFQFVKSLD